MISLSLCPKELTSDPFVFESGLRFEARRLAKLAPALEAEENSIGVWLDEQGELFIWGFAPQVGVSLSIRTHEPGQLLMSFGDAEQGFTMLVSGSRTEFVDARNLPPKWTPPLLQPSRRDDHKQIAKFMRSHACGGTLLLVNKESSWKNSIHQPVTFIGGQYEKIKNDILYRDKVLDQELNKDFLTLHHQRIAREDANKSLATIGKLTAVDGATLIIFDLDVLGFGAKIKARSGTRKPERLLISEPFEESVTREIRFSDLGGTRHQSAAQFVFDQRDTIAIVASQDKKLSVLGWEQKEGKVTIIRSAEFALL